MDIARGELVEQELTGLIERRGRQVGEDRLGQEHANGLEAIWAASECRHAEKRRKELHAERYRWHYHLSEVYLRRHREHEAAAAALLEENERKETA